MASRHHEAVRKLAKQHKYGGPETVYAHRVSGFPDPEIRVGDGDHTPDLVLEYDNGREKLIEVDTEPRSARDERQHRAFQRSADAKKHVRSYENIFASEVLD